MQPRYTEVSARVLDPDVRRLLAVLAWRGIDGEVEAIAAPYLDGQARLFAAEVDGKAVACVGVHPSHDGAELRTVATLEEHRRRRFASGVIAHLVAELDLDLVWAETDDDAVGFYRAAGFEIESLGEKYPGVVRYRCTRRR